MYNNTLYKIKKFIIYTITYIPLICQTVLSKLKLKRRNNMYVCVCGECMYVCGCVRVGVRRTHLRRTCACVCMNAYISIYKDILTNPK